ncbi:MAG: hypothetical protein KBB54_00425 [Candidatus Pacebacteria bacterium]|nr:hypothetical protein [Candidatus Paceibacterota bacterium]MBP9818423.1 hypothetical protein [Candidatus Paceibacterota bacterium]
MHNLKEPLSRYGLDKNEIEIYLFLLKNKDVPAYFISKGTSIPRTTVYKILEGLEKKALVSAWLKNGTKHFSAENPNTILRDLKQKETEITSILPDLSNLFSLSSIHPSTKLYLGKEGCQQAFETILDIVKSQKIKCIYAYSDSEVTSLFPKFYKEWRLRKNKTDAFTQLIVPAGTPTTSEEYRSDSFRETRILPNKYSFSGSINICGTYTIFFSFNEKEPYAVVVDSKIITDMLTQFFVYTWDSLENTKR